MTRATHPDAAWQQHDTPSPDCLVDHLKQVAAGYKARATVCNALVAAMHQRIARGLALTPAQLARAIAISGSISETDTFPSDGPNTRFNRQHLDIYFDAMRLRGEIVWNESIGEWDDKPAAVSA